jgi:hypothetical protein
MIPESLGIGGRRKYSGTSTEIQQDLEQSQAHKSQPSHVVNFLAKKIVHTKGEGNMSEFLLT